MSRVLEIASAACLGVLAGAMLLIAVSVVPFWQSLEPPEFLSWFARYSSLIGGLMVPLGAIATLTTVVAALSAWRTTASGARWFLVASALVVGVALVYPLYFSSANEAFVQGTLVPAEVPQELLRWRAWHWARTVAGLGAFLAALVGLSRRH